MNEAQIFVEYVISNIDRGPEAETGKSSKTPRSNDTERTLSVKTGRLYVLKQGAFELASDRENERARSKMKPAARRHSVAH